MAVVMAMVIPSTKRIQEQQEEEKAVSPIATITIGISINFNIIINSSSIISIPWTQCTWTIPRHQPFLPTCEFFLLATKRITALAYITTIKPIARRRSMERASQRMEAMQRALVVLVLVILAAAHRKPMSLRVLEACRFLVPRAVSKAAVAPPFWNECLPWVPHCRRSIFVLPWAVVLQVEPGEGRCWWGTKQQHRQRPLPRSIMRIRMQIRIRMRIT